MNFAFVVNTLKECFSFLEPLQNKTQLWGEVIAHQAFGDGLVSLWK